MRYLFATLVFLFVPLLLLSGELKVTILSVPQTCVGDTLKVNARVENTNATYPINFVSTQVYVRRAGTLVCQKFVTPVFVLAPLQSKEMMIDMGWVADTAGALDVELRAVSPEATNSPQYTTSTTTICGSGPCPSSPTLSASVIYLGVSSTGSVTATTPRPDCCYEVKFTIAAGRPAVTSYSPEVWTPVQNTAISVTVDRTKLATTTLVGRLDWKTCDGTSRGSTHLLIRDGTETQAASRTDPPTPVTGDQLPQGGIVGDPISTASLEFRHTAPIDIVTHAHLDLIMQRDYLSKLPLVRSNEHDFGPAWTHTYDYSLIRGDGERYILCPAGRIVRFVKDGNAWSLNWPIDRRYAFTELSDTVASFHDPQTGHIYLFDEQGRLRALSSQDGMTCNVSYSGPWISKVLTPGKRGLTISRDTVGRIVSITNGLSTVRYGYTGGVLSTFTDGNDNITTYSYQPSTPFLISWRTPELRSPFANVYDTTGGVVTQDLGEEVKIDLSRSGTITTIGQTAGVASTHEHNAAQQLVRSVSASGGTATFFYNTNGQRTGVTDMLGGERIDLYSDNLFIGRRNPDGTGFDLEYGTHQMYGIPISSVNHVEVIDGPSVVYQRSTVTGVITKITHSDGAEESMFYTQAVPWPMGTHDFYGGASWSNTGDGMPTSIFLDRDGYLGFGYDIAGNITRLSRYGRLFSYTYDGNGKMTSRTVDGATVRWAYDKDGLLQSTTDAMNREWTCTRDSRSRLIEVRGPLGTIRKQSWRGPQITRIESVDGARYDLSWSIDGHLSAITNRLGHLTTITRDAEGAPRTLLLPDGSTWHFERDNMGRTSLITSPSGLTTIFQYGSTGNISNITYPNGNVLNVQWNSDHNSSTSSLNGSISISFQRRYQDSELLTEEIRDADHYLWKVETFGPINLSRIVAPSGHQTFLYYSSEGSIDTIRWSDNGFLMFEDIDDSTRTISDGTKKNTYVLNANHDIIRINGDAILHDKAGKMIGYNGVSAKRSPSGRIEDLSWDGEVQARYAYDEASRLNTITDRLGGVTNFELDANGRFRRISMPGNVSITYEYTVDGFPSKITTNDGWYMQYHYDGKGRVISVERSDDVPFHATLVKTTRENTFDQDGNLKGGTYDQWQNLTAHDDSEVSYVYSGLGLVGIRSQGVDYNYSSDGFCAVKRLELGSSTYLSATYNHITTVPTPAKVSDSTGVRTYVSTPDGRPLYWISDQGEYGYLIDDGYGNVVREVSLNDQLDLTTWYTPFGELIGIKGRQCLLGFQGMYGAASLDQGQTVITNGMVYSPEIGRFASRTGYRSGFPYGGVFQGELTRMISYKEPAQRPIEYILSNPWKLSFQPKGNRLFFQPTIQLDVGSPTSISTAIRFGGLLDVEEKAKIGSLLSRPTEILGFIDPDQDVNIWEEWDAWVEFESLMNDLDWFFGPEDNPAIDTSIHLESLNSTQRKK